MTLFYDLLPGYTVFPSILTIVFSIVVLWTGYKLRDWFPSLFTR